MKIPLGERLVIGRRVLCGERLGVLAPELGVSRETIARCADEHLYSLRDFNAAEYLQILRTPGLGHLRAARKLYKSICEKSAPAQPATVWHCGLRAAITRSLTSAGFESREQVLHAYRDGRIGATRTPQDRTGRLYKLGRKSLEEIAAWLNEDPPSEKEKKTRITAAIALLESRGYRVLNSGSDG